MAPAPKTRSQSAEGRYKSQAQLIEEYHRATPDRFKTKPKPPVRRRSASPVPSPRLTQPETPCLATRGRFRPPKAKSSQELEEEAMAVAKMNQFKAHKVGETLPKFKYGEVEKKSCTVPKPFTLSTSSKTSMLPPEDLAEPFQRNPSQKKILQSQTGVPEKKTKNVIEPQSPAFCLKSRMAERKIFSVPEPAEVDKLVRSKPVPHRGIPVSLPPPTLMSKKSTIPEPFSFEERNNRLEEKKQEKIQKILDEEKVSREFHATEIPKVVETGTKLPQRPIIQPTKVEPFKLAIDERVDARLARWQEGVDKEIEEQKKATIFRATEPKVLEVTPFMPKKIEKPLTEVSNIVLHSDKRAEEREKYELKVKAKEVEVLAAKREQEERKRRLEEAEVAKLRQAAVHKAQPIKSYKPVEVHGSEKPLTLPSSPQFKLGARRKDDSTTSDS